MKKVLYFFFIVFSASFVKADGGVISVESSHTVQLTVERLESILTKKGLTIFTVVDHAQGAKKVDTDLRDPKLVIFGNPKVGSKLMLCQQSVALDLPQKFLVWKDQAGKVWVSYNEPGYLKERHKVTGCDPVFAKIKNVISDIVAFAVK